MNDLDTIICRCEEITLGEIKEAISLGCHSVSSIKKFTRAGMGSCQGRICSQLIMDILIREGIEVKKEDRISFPNTPLLFKIKEKIND